MISFGLKYRNARNAVRKIRRGEFKPRINTIDGLCYTASNGEFRLWLANGAFFCEIDEVKGERCAPAFGLIWRHYVWWAAARKLKFQADRDFRGKITPVL